MNRLMVILLLTLSTVVAFAYTSTGYFTGKQRTVQTITGQTGLSCQYSITTDKGLEYFWHTFANTYVCPNSIEVE